MSKLHNGDSYRDTVRTARQGGAHLPASDRARGGYPAEQGASETR